MLSTKVEDPTLPVDAKKIIHDPPPFHPLGGA